MTPEPDDSRDDEALLVGLRGGDMGCLESLTHRYWPAIARFAGNYLNDAALGEDVAQETFTKLASPANVPTGAIRPWLYRVARNHCLDIHRRHGRSPTHYDRIRTGFDAAGSGKGPGSLVVRHERQALIRAIVDQMPDDFRTVLMMKFYEGLTRAEMAEALEVSEATIKGRVGRAAVMLEEQLRKITGSHNP